MSQATKTNGIDRLPCSYVYRSSHWIGKSVGGLCPCWYIHCQQLCSLVGEYNISCICSWLGINTSAIKHSQCWYKEYVGRNSWVPITRAAESWKYWWEGWCIQLGRRVGRDVWRASSLGRLHTLSNYVQAHSGGGSSTHQSPPFWSARNLKCKKLQELLCWEGKEGEQCCCIKQTPSTC